jgi:hypothetical protein
MSNRLKKIFLIFSIALPFLIYCVYYYSMMIRNAPYKFSEFTSLELDYGNGDSLINRYNSSTGDYEYVNAHDSLVKTRMYLTKDQLLYLHRKAAELGFWNFPDLEENYQLRAKGVVSPHYLIEFNYKRKSKKVLFDAGFDGDPKLKDANERLIKEIQKVLADAEERERK